MHPASYLILILQCLLPIFDKAAGDYVGLSIVNTDTQSRDVTVTATSANGSRLQAGLLTLNPGRQRAFLLEEVAGPGTPSPGWIRIGSAPTGCPIYMASGNDQALAGTDAGESSSTVVWLPHISINTGFVELAYTETQLSIVNANAAGATVSAQLIGLDGAVKATLPISVPANGSRVDSVSELFRDALPNNSAGGKFFEGYARLSSDVPISAWQRIDTPLSRTMLRGIATPAQVSTLVIPHFVIGGGLGFDSILNLVNTGPGNSVVEVKAFDDRGNAIGETVQLTLRGGEGRRATVGELFRIVSILIFPPPIISGYISIRPLPTAQPAAAPLLATVEILARDGLGKTSAMLSTALSSNSTKWTLPFAASSAPFFTGYAVANVTQIASQADVQVEILNSGGDVVDRKSLSISPGRRETALIPSGITSGYVRFTSNLPVYVIGTVGTTDLKILDQVPVLPR